MWSYTLDTHFILKWRAGIRSMWENRSWWCYHHPILFVLAVSGCLHHFALGLKIGLPPNFMAWWSFFLINIARHWGIQWDILGLENLAMWFQGSMSDSTLATCILSMVVKARDPRGPQGLGRAALSYHWLLTAWWNPHELMSVEMKCPEKVGLSELFR